jgi:7-cyano-7-deazaguanine synthase
MAAMLSSVDSATLVLLSGGIDSCATLALYRRRAEPVVAMFVEYGQTAAKHEHAAAARVAEYYETNVRTATLTGLGNFHEGYIRGRNALLLQVALTAAPFEVGQIAIGLHAGTSYPDCSPFFVSEMQRSFDVYCSGRLRVVAPFIDDDKRSVVEFCRESAVPLHLTYSCERGTMPPCGTCLSCLDRAAFDVS